MILPKFLIYHIQPFLHTHHCLLGMANIMMEWYSLETKLKRSCHCNLNKRQHFSGTSFFNSKGLIPMGKVAQDQINNNPDILGDYELTTDWFNTKVNVTVKIFDHSVECVVCWCIFKFAHFIFKS